MEKRRVSLGGKPGSCKRRYLHLLVERLRARLVCPPPRALPRPRLPAAPARSSPRPRCLGTADPRRGGGTRRCHFCRSRTASGCHPGPTTRLLRPAQPSRIPRPVPGPPPSPSPGAQRCSPIVRSPEPGLLGAPSRGAGAGPGAWEPLTAASQRSLPSRRRRRLPPWLRRRHLTTEVTHLPLLPARALAQPLSRAPPLTRRYGPKALGLGGFLTMGGSIQARGQIAIVDWFRVGSGLRPVK